MTALGPGPGDLQGLAGKKVGSPVEGGPSGLACGRASEKAQAKYVGGQWRKVAKKEEIFPLPSCEVEPPPRSGLSRRGRNRVGKRRHFQEDIGECSWALDWCSGLAGESPIGPPSSQQQEVLERVESAVRRRVSPRRADLAPRQPVARCSVPAPATAHRER